MRKRLLNPATVLKREQARAARERLEVELALFIRIDKLDTGMVRQWKPFDDIGYLFDFAWPAQRLAVEVQGGIWSAGAHTRPEGVLRDMDKANRCSLAGIRLLQLSAADIRSGKAVELIRRGLALPAPALTEA